MDGFICSARDAVARSGKGSPTRSATSRGRWLRTVWADLFGDLMRGRVALWRRRITQCQCTRSTLPPLHAARSCFPLWEWCAFAAQPSCRRSTNFANPSVSGVPGTMPGWRSGTRNPARVDRHHRLVRCASFARIADATPRNSPVTGLHRRPEHPSRAGIYAGPNRPNATRRQRGARRTHPPNSRLRPDLPRVGRNPVEARFASEKDVNHAAR